MTRDERVELPYQPCPGPGLHCPRPRGLVLVGAETSVEVAVQGVGGRVGGAGGSVGRGRPAGTEERAVPLADAEQLEPGTAVVVVVADVVVTAAEAGEMLGHEGAHNGERRHCRRGRPAMPIMPALAFIGSFPPLFFCRCLCGFLV